MAKPTTEPSKKYAGPPARRVRAVRNGNNDYTIIEEIFEGPPTSTRVLKEHSPRVPAEDRVRLWNEEFLGPNRFADSGL